MQLTENSFIQLNYVIINCAQISNNTKAQHFSMPSNHQKTQITNILIQNPKFNTTKTDLEHF